MGEDGLVRERGRGRPRETSHDEIRDIALALFAENGYAKTSLASIAKTAGISRTTLFTYFHSKRDLIWEDHDQRATDIDDALEDGPAHPVVDLILRGLLAGANYTISDHTTLAARMRVVQQDDELRAYAVLADHDATRRVATGAASRAPESDPRLINLVTRALAAAASACIAEWASQDQPTADLDTHTAAGIQPIADALRPLLR